MTDTDRLRSYQACIQAVGARWSAVPAPGQRVPRARTHGGTLSSPRRVSPTPMTLVRSPLFNGGDLKTALRSALSVDCRPSKSRTLLLSAMARSDQNPPHVRPCRRESTPGGRSMIMILTRCSTTASRPSPCTPLLLSKSKMSFISRHALGARGCLRAVSQGSATVSAVRFEGQASCREIRAPACPSRRHRLPIHSQSSRTTDPSLAR